MDKFLRSARARGGQSKIWWRKGLAFAGQLTLLTLLLGSLPASAQILRPEVSEPFLSDPLLDEPRDPLLPTTPVSRPLSPLERLALETGLDELNQAALAALQAGQEEVAFALWIREVRLRRLLGLPQEIAAIQRVGGYAWEAGRTQEIQLLTAQLRRVRQQVEAATPLDQRLLVEIATGFEILGEPNDAIALYRQLANLAVTAGNTVLYQAYLEKIAALESDWFQFAAAATTYRELYQLVQGQVAPLSAPYLQREIANLEQAQQFEQATVVQQELLDLYQAGQVLEVVPELQRATAQNFQTAGNLEAASRYYQAAYTNAITLEQFEVASQVIDELALVYRTLGRLDDVLYLYQQRLLVNRQVYDAYTIMENFDQLGQLYEEMDQPTEAVAAFQEGLILAAHLGHRQNYFTEQIRRLAPESMLTPGESLAPGEGTSEPTSDQPLPSTLPLENSGPQNS
ncbi:MAG: hypothetical protein ICV77_06190, partial [Cyanobacteria bacterium Co-bin8]|nr:hypothetical protein [Cyanobacteria bacterium Co-bin8]